MANHPSSVNTHSYSPSLAPYWTRSESFHREDLELGTYREATEISGQSPKPSGEFERNSYGYCPVSNTEYARLISAPKYRLYKRRFFGLAQLTLLNFTIGWGYAAPGIISTTAAKWYGITYAQLNYLSIAGSLVFLLPAPFVVWVLNRHGPKLSILVACVLTVTGNWIIYAGAHTHSFPASVVGTVVHSLASPFVLCAPTRYSRQWFDDRSRTVATALPSLAYPLGAGIGALTGPYMVKPNGPFSYDTQALLIALVFTVAAIPAPFIPGVPRTPPSAAEAAPKLAVRDSLKSLMQNPPFYIQFMAFAVFSGAIDTVTAITNQGIEPYGYPQASAGSAIACLIFVGIAAALIVSPILDRTKWHLSAMKLMVIIIAIAFTAVPFIPQTRSVAALCAVFAVLGAACLSIEPCVLEFQAAWTHPVSPEFSSVFCWAGAKVMGAVFTVVVGNELALEKPAEGQPVGSLFNGLIFMAVMVWLCVPGTLVNGHWIFKKPAFSEVEADKF